MANNSTKQLAKQLGLLKRRSSTLPQHKFAKETNAKLNKKEQIFKYVVVLDFESTCWENKESKYSPEIIEFPAVLVNLTSGEIEDKFQYYVQPTEHCKLSPFCISLTGITQEIVDNGVPIATALKLFSDWLDKHISEKRIFFPSKSKPSGYHKAIFVTWSDWDLNTCLQYECKRKKVTYTPHLKSWIDLRKIYRTFYDCKPQGLNGALKEVGIQFEGREHSGIDDAINTSRLLLRMIKDGCVLKATKSLILSLEECNRYEDLSIIMNQGGDLNCSKIPDNDNASSMHQVDKVDPKPSDKNQVHDLNSKVLGVVNLNTKTCSNHVGNLNPNIEPQSKQIQPSTRTSSDNSSTTYRDSKLQTHVTPVVSKENTPNTVCNQGKIHLQKPKLKVGMSKHTPIALSKQPSIQNNDLLTVTPPLCDCGRRCKRKKVVNPGPNIGRVFYSCPSKRMGVPKIVDACKFFKWENNVTKSSLMNNVSAPRLGVLPLPKLGVLPSLKCGTLQTDVPESFRNKRAELKNQYKSLFHVN